MRIHVPKIGSEGQILEGSISHEFIGERDDDALKFIEPLKVKTKAEKTDDSLLVHTEILGRYASECSRCLVAVEQEWNTKFLLDFEITRNTEFVDIAEDIRQEVFLGLPSRIVCSEECKGICPGCGVNLNKDKCKCNKKE